MTAALWQPFTSAGGPAPRQIVKGEGNSVIDADGNRLLDGTAGGVACVIVGHGRSEIAEAVRSQLETLEYYCLFGYSHPMAEKLAAEIAARTPGDLNHVFFTNSGSEAVETALKIARAYWRRHGLGQKTKYISLQNGYHGMNFGGISIGGLTENRTAFGPLLSGCSQVLAHDLDALAKELQYQDPATVAAIIMEPVQAAGGVYPPPEDYLAGVRALCSANNVLLILDEVVCGWGRLGHWFGGHRYDVVADIMTTAKGLTSAYIPMGAAIASEDVHRAFVDDDGGIELMHGYTYSGHPAACAAGLAVIDIIEREGLVEHAENVGRHLQQRVRELTDVDLVEDVRGEGMLAAIELGGDSPISLVGKTAQAIQERGVLVRAQEDHLGIYPPLTFDKADIDRVVDATGEALATFGFP